MLTVFFRGEGFLSLNVQDFGSLLGSLRECVGSSGPRRPGVAAETSCPFTGIMVAGGGFLGSSDLRAAPHYVLYQLCERGQITLNLFDINLFIFF